MFQILPVGVPKVLEPLPKPLTTNPDKKCGKFLAHIMYL